MKDILTFKTDEHSWLSNMEIVDIECDGIVYKSTENFYQACKYNDIKTKQLIAKLNPYKAKKYSRNNPMTNKSFDDNKLTYMEYALTKKFSQEPFKSKLLATGGCHIEEGNWWGDTFWGVDIKTRKGENNLGKLIMKIRSNLYAKSFDDIVEIPLIGERKATSGLENCSVWLD